MSNRHHKHAGTPKMGGGNVACYVDRRMDARRLQSTTEYQNLLGKGSSKLQSAMEYLMTYGWAILIIAVVLGVLYYLGIFNGQNLAPRLQPGSCHVARTSAGVENFGVCAGLPEFVASFASQNAAANSAIQATISSQPITSQITIAFWADNVPSCTSLNACTYMHLSGPGNPVCSGYYGFWITRGEANLCTSAGSVAIYYAYPTSWTFYTLTASPGLAVAYENGASVGQSNTISSISINSIVMGDYAYPGSDNWDSDKGHLANVQVYNTSLSAAEVQALYMEGIGGAPIKPANVTGWWPLNGDANDYSGNNNNGQSTNVQYTNTWINSYSAP